MISLRSRDWRSWKSEERAEVDSTDRESGSPLATDVATGPGTTDPTTSAARLFVQLVLGAGAGTALALLLWPFLPALVTAGVLALVLLPLHRRLRTWTGRDHVAAGATTLAGIAGLLVPLVLVGVLVVRELSAAADWLTRQGPSMLASLPRLERVVDRWVERLGVRGIEVGEVVAGQVQELPDLLLGRAFGFVAGVGGVVLQTGVALFALFFLLRDGHRIEASLRALVPLDAHRTSALLYRSREVVSAAVYGNLLVAIAQGTAGGVAFLVLGLPVPALWGCIMSAASLVPMVGPGVVWLPASLLLLVSGSVWRGVLLLAFGIFVISTVDNVLRSLLVGSRARIHPLVILLGVLGGIFLFGAVGVIVGPVVLVVSLLLLEMVRMSLFPSAPAAEVSPDGAAAERSG